MLRKLFTWILVIVNFHICYGQTGFSSRGIGGGGALFAPAVNPSNHNEFYISCDMSELFHTGNGGQSYQIVNFQELQGGHHSQVCFTSNNQIRYCIGYANDQAVPMKSTDQGITWNTLPGNPDVWEETYFIAADFNNPNRLVISFYNEIYFSIDGGNSFTLIHTAANPGNGVLVAGAFFDGSKVYIGTNDGLLVSLDSGSSFMVSNISGIPATEAMYSFAGAKQGAVTRFYCLTANAADVYVDIQGSDYWGLNQGIYTLDYGSGIWTPKMNGIIAGSQFPMFVSMAGNDIATAYIAGSNSNSEPVVLKTSNAGTQWNPVFNTTGNQNIATGWCGAGGDRQWGYAECPFGFTVAANDPNLILMGDYGFVHVSTDGGTSWKQAYVSSADQNTQGSNTPTGKSYHSIGLENTTCWQVHWINQNSMFSCFSDIRGCRSTDGGQSWNLNYTGHSQNSMYRIAQHANGTLYAATSTVHDIYQSTRLQDLLLDAASADGKIIYSTDQGSTWQDLHDFSHPVFWVSTDPNNINRMYASVINHSQGLGGIYRSDNIQNGSASTWTKLPDPPRTEGHPATIAVLNDGKVVCSFSGRRNPTGSFTNSSGVFMYDPISNSWSDLSDNGMHYWTKDIVIDPQDPSQNTWYAGVFNGWGGPPNGLGGLYRTTNRGQSWTRIYNGSSVTSLTFRPGHQGEAYITTEQNGLLYASDLSQAIPVISTVQDYPFRQPERVFFNPYNPDEMWITSFGYGMTFKNMALTGIDDKNTESRQSIVYPNPSQGNMTINLQPSYSGLCYFEVTNMTGQVITRFEKQCFPGIKLSLENLKKGMYLLKAGDGLTTHYEKFIVE